MRKLLLLGAAAAALGIAGTAQAATCVTTSGGVDQCVYDPITDPENFSVTFNPDGTISAGLKHNGIDSGPFQDIFFFFVEADGSGSGGVNTTASGGIGSSTDLDFTDADVFTGASLAYDPVTNSFSIVGGTNYDLGMTNTPLPGFPAGYLEFAGGSDIPLFNGEFNYIVITGTARGNGSYGGNATFTPDGAVPEPATWAMMLFGFGAIGFAMRRRRKENVRVRFAM